MKTRLLIATLSFITLFAVDWAAAQGPPAQVTPAQGIVINPRYQPGQKLSLQLEIQSDDARDNSQRKTYHTPISLRVVRKSTTGTQLEWQAGVATKEGGAAPADPIFEMAEKIFADLRLQVQLDPTGQYLGLRNESELKAKIQEFVTLLAPQATAKIADAATRQRNAEAITKALTPETLLSAARKEIDLFFGLSGLRLEAGKTTRIKSALLNPFGPTGTLDGEMEITPGPPNAVTGETRVAFAKKYDPTLSYDSAGKSASADPSQQMSLDDKGEFVMDSTTWQVKQVRHVRTIRRNKEAVRTETTVITVQ